MTKLKLGPGAQILHPEFGVGVVLEAPREAYVRVFFTIGERRVPLASLRRELSRTERILYAPSKGAPSGYATCGSPTGPTSCRSWRARRR